LTAPRRSVVFIPDHARFGTRTGRPRQR
jgi:hypothetical protein